MAGHLVETLNFLLNAMQTFQQRRAHWVVERPLCQFITVDKGQMLLELLAALRQGIGRETVEGVERLLALCYELLHALDLGLHTVALLLEQAATLDQTQIGLAYVTKPLVLELPGTPIPPLPVPAVLSVLPRHLIGFRIIGRAQEGQQARFLFILLQAWL